MVTDHVVHVAIHVQFFTSDKFSWYVRREERVESWTHTKNVNTHITSRYVFNKKVTYDDT